MLWSRWKTRHGKLYRRRVLSYGPPGAPPSSSIRDTASSSKCRWVRENDSEVLLVPLRQEMDSNKALSSIASRSCNTPQSSASKCPADTSSFRSAKCIRSRPFNCWMEILPSALCCRMRVPLFIRIKTIRKSGYFARVLELLPVSRCQESSRRNSCSSLSKSMSKRGSAKPGNRFNASIPSPGWQVLRFVTMMNTFLLCISCATAYFIPRGSPYQRMSGNYGDRTREIINHMSQQNWSTLHNIRVRHPATEIHCWTFGDLHKRRGRNWLPSSTSRQLVIPSSRRQRGVPLGYE